MNKITHKGLWFEYSSLNKEDKRTTKKVVVSGLLCGFFIGLASNKASLLMWSDLVHPLIFYVLPILTIITGFLTLKYSFELYKRQDELYKKYHDFSLISGFIGFAIFGLILHFISIYNEFQPQWIDYLFCSILGMVIGQMYFYKKFYQ